MVISKTLGDVCKYFEECTGTTSVHGVQFIGDRKRSIFERLVWLVIWLASVVTCTKYVMQTYEKWESSPVFVTIGTGQVPIHDISFPAVTICSEAKTDFELYSYPKMMDLALSEEVNLTETETLQFEYMSMICNRTDEPISRKYEYFSDDILHFLNNVTPPFDEVFVNCKFSGIKQNCSDIFTPVFTADGVCYSFNILDHKEMFNDGVQQYEDFNKAQQSICFNQPFTNNCTSVYPKRASNSGAHFGLEVELQTFISNLDFKCASPLQGYKVTLHDPSELPGETHNQLRVPLEQAVFAAITPEVIVTKNDLKSYPSHQRKCFFDDERILERFRHYSHLNCEMECLIFLQSNGLDCLDFFLPQTNTTEHICGPKLQMYMGLFQNLLSNFMTRTKDLNLTPEMMALKNTIEDFGFLDEVHEQCDCLPSCSSVEYAFEASQTDYFWRKFLNSKSKTKATSRSFLNIHFKQAQYIPLERKEMFGAMDFIAYCGGLLGLFIGFSFISLMEVIYFLTLRIGCNVKMYGRKLWHGVEE